MIVLSALSYIADIAIIGTYFLLARNGNARAFHWANALGCFPLIAGEVIVHAWPVLPVTTFFGIAGWYGLWIERRKAKHAWEFKVYVPKGMPTYRVDGNVVVREGPALRQLRPPTTRSKQ